MIAALPTVTVIMANGRRRRIPRRAPFRKRFAPTNLFRTLALVTIAMGAATDKPSCASSARFDTDSKELYVDKHKRTIPLTRRGTNVETNVEKPPSF
jgi:hypothetical protein